MQINEIWKDIPGYEGLYQVSDYGRVRSLNYLGHEGKVKVLRIVIANGYYYLTLYKDGKKKGFRVHRLVVTAFIGPIPRGMVVNHINENKLDNRLSNLEICTQKYNNNWGTRNERLSKKLIGNTSASKKLQLIKHDTDTKLSFNSAIEASAFFGYSHKQQISSLISKARKKGKNLIKIKGDLYKFIH